MERAVYVDTMLARTLATLQVGRDAGLNQHREDEMRQVFDMADGDGSGCISRDEYFFWMLRWMAQSGQASGLERNFQRFDASGDGELNEREWSMASDRFGFGEIGHQVFKELDADRTGTVSYKELIAKLNQDRSKIKLEWR